MDLLPPTAPSLVFARETCRPYSRAKNTRTQISTTVYCQDLTQDSNPGSVSREFAALATAPATRQYKYRKSLYCFYKPDRVFKNRC